MRLPILALAALVAVPVSAQVSSADSVATLYSQNRMAEALPIARRVASARGAGLDARARLAEIQLLVGEGARDSTLLAEAVQNAEAVLERDSCNVPSLLVKSRSLVDIDPSASDDAQDRAVACAPDDGNVWLAFWTVSVREGRLSREQDALRALGRLGFWSQPMLAFARWTLRAAPQNSLLLADGPSDAAVLRMVQDLEGVRPDVVIVPFSMLEYPGVLSGLAQREVPVLDPAGFQPRPDARGSRDSAGGRMYTLADAVLDRWLEDGHVVVGSITLDPLVLGTKGGVVDRGALLAPGPSSFDADAATASFRGIDPSAFDGPAVTPGDRDPVRRASPFDPGGVVLFQMLQTAVAHAQEGDEEAAESAYAQAVSFAQGSGRESEPLVPIAREWVDDALSND
ncbi:hypothetical protein [Rubrivirga sp.]|uniref:hypothetical protein n=1 Tax=Rubrivirga sp. TaxID=1885344 RepID=UPI003C71611A